MMQMKNRQNNNNLARSHGIFGDQLQQLQLLNMIMQDNTTPQSVSDFIDAAGS